MPHSFTRDKTFWVIALQVTILNFYLGGFGPAQPLLRADQGTSLTIAGLHGTAMGIAAICAGLSNSRLVHFFGREKTSWIGMWLFCIGVIMFVSFKSVAFTLTATFLGGMGTSMVINNMVTRLSHTTLNKPLPALCRNQLALTLLDMSLELSSSEHWPEPPLAGASVYC